MSLSVIKLVAPIIIAIVAVWVGRYEARILRKETGDRSTLINILSWQFPSKKEARRTA